MAQVNGASVATSAPSRFTNPQNALASSDTQSFETSLQFALATKIAPLRSSYSASTGRRGQVSPDRTTRQSNASPVASRSKNQPEASDLYGGDAPSNDRRANSATNRPRQPAPRPDRSSPLADISRPSAFKALADKAFAAGIADGHSPFQTAMSSESSFEMMSVSLSVSTIESTFNSVNGHEFAIGEAGSMDEGTAIDELEPAKVELPVDALGAFLAAFLAMQAQLAQPINSGNEQFMSDAQDIVGGIGSTSGVVSFSSVTLSVQVLSAQLVTGQGDAGEIASKLATLGGFDSDEIVIESLKQMSGMALSPDSDAQSISDLFAAISSLVQPEKNDGSSSDQLGELLAAMLARSSDNEEMVFSATNLEMASIELQTTSTGNENALAQLAAHIAREMSASNGAVFGPVSGSPTNGSLTDSVAAATSLMSIAEIGQKMNMSSIQGSTTLSIQLNLDSLGTIDVAIEKTANGILAHINAQTVDGEAAVKSTMDQVRGALLAAGVKVDDIQIRGPSDRPQTAPVQESTQVSAQPASSANTDNGSRSQSGDQSNGNATSAQVTTSAASNASTRPVVAFDAFANGITATNVQMPTNAVTSVPVETDAATAVDNVDQAQMQAQGGIAGNPGASTSEVDVTDSSPSDDSVGSVSGPTSSAGQINQSRTEGTGQTAAPTNREAAAQLVKDIATQIGTLAAQGKSEFQLQLRPDALGRLHLRMSLDDGTVTVRMTAETAEARGAIESNLSQLRQSFQDQGLRVDRFVIDVAQAGQFSQQDGGHPRRSRGWVDPELNNNSSSSNDDFAQVLAGVGGANRPVDYRA